MMNPSTVQPWILLLTPLLKRTPAEMRTKNSSTVTQRTKLRKNCRAEEDRQHLFVDVLTVSISTHLVIPAANTSSHPRTVMIHLLNTRPTMPAMVGSVRLDV